LVDGDLELIAPQFVWIDDVLAGCQHPLTLRDDPAESRVSRQQLTDFLNNAPYGHQPADPMNGIVPTYHFWMRLNQPQWNDSTQGPLLHLAGGMGFRVGHTPDIELYYGHVGYHVFPAARGRHYAQRSVQLILPLARRHGFKALWITCNPENTASRRTCERLGCELIETVTVPSNHALYLRGERHKCRYLLRL
jgi:tagatose 1,6-diphosphate aldolase